MLLITKNGVKSLIERISSEHNMDECTKELEKMIEIKNSLLWRAETAKCCVGWELPAQFAGEVDMLEKALAALQNGDKKTTIALLDNFSSRIE